MVEPDPAAIAAHRDVVRGLATPGGPLAADSPHSTMNNPAWFDPATGFTPERRSLHRRIIAEHRATQPDVRQDRLAVVLAGPPGAGKSTALQRVLGSTLTRYLHVDADDFKAALLEEARRDGTLESLKPPAVRELEQSGERFYPLELASLVHEESSRLAKRVRRDAIREGTNLVIDSVLKDPAAAEQMGAHLGAAGYQVRVIDVECSYDASLARVAHRWDFSYRAALVDEGQALGGRWVPSEYVRGVFGGPEGRSWPEESARRLAQTCAAVTHYDVYRLADGASVPERVTALGRPRAGGPLVDIAAADAVRRAEAGRTSPPPDRGPTSRGRGFGR